MKIGKNYFVYLLLSVLLILMLEIYLSFSEIKQNLKEDKSYLNTALFRLKKEKDEIIKLKEKVKELSIRPLNKEEALQKILESVDYFVKMYDAKITKSLVEKDSTFFISVSFDYYPESSEDLIKFMMEINRQVLPQVLIESFRMDNLKEGTKAYFEISLEQPFKGEK